MALVLLLSRQKPPRGGFCTDSGSPDGVPLTSRDISLLISDAVEIVEEMLNRCADKSIGWIRFVDCLQEHC